MVQLSRQAIWTFYANTWFGNPCNEIDSRKEKQVDPWSENDQQPIKMTMIAAFNDSFNY